MAKFRLPSWLSASRGGESTLSSEFDEKSSQRSLRREKPSRKSLVVSRARPKTDHQPSPRSHMVLLAEKILAETEKLDAYMQLNDLPSPGFDTDAPTSLYDLANEVRRSRQEIANATRELSGLAMGPRETVRWTAWSFLDSLSLQILNKYGIAKLVPLNGSISLKNLGRKTTLDAVNLARALRHAMTNRIFQEPSPGYIAHTAASRLLAEDQSTQDWVGFNCEEVFPASGHVLEALEKSPEASSPTHTGFNYAFATVGREPLFATVGKDPARARRLGGAMANLTAGEGYEVRHLVDNWDLSEVDARRGVVVDLGGSHGFVAVDLAKRWRRTRFIVQDLPRMVESAPSPVCSDEGVSSRIEFQAHDFFQEQPVKGADVYFFRWVVHNYSAAYAVAILKNLVPALKAGARVVINEHCLSEPGRESAWDERLIRGMDLVMLALLNAEERDEAAFRALFAAADKRFEFAGIKRVENYRMGVVEAIWRP